MGIDARVIAAVVIAGSIAVLVALILPWATFRDRGLGATIEIDGGSARRVLVGVLAVALIALAVIRVRRPSLGPTLAEALGAGVLLLAVAALALHAISTANHLTSPFPGSTAYGPGALLGALGAAAASGASALALIGVAGAGKPSEERSST